MRYDGPSDGYAMSDEFLSEEEELLITSLPKELIARIDAALLAKAESRFRKVALIVGSVPDAVPDLPKDLPRNFYAQRIARLVDAGLMESRGDLRRSGFSEVRIPSPSLPKAELDEMIAEEDYWTLGGLYAEGQGVPQDYTEALKWYRLAAERGDVWSQFNVGRLYLNGNGVQQDYEVAYFWFSLAAARASSDTCPFKHWRGVAARKLAPALRAEVDQQVAQWKPTSASRRRGEDQLTLKKQQRSKLTLNHK
jgi:hypothetical protein